MRVRVLFLTSGIRAVLSCSLNIFCSSPFHASLGSQPVAETPAVSAHPSSPTQTSSSSSEAAPSPRSSPPLACHVRRTVLALGRLERAAPVALFLPMTTETASSSWQERQRGSRRRSGQPRTPRGAVAAVLTSAGAPAALRAGARAAAVSPMAAAAQTGADVPTAGLTEIAAIVRDVGLDGG
jgi:hypothetical protein